MSWSNVQLIFLRAVRDQLRDRRTLFVIAVLPLLLYPLMGTIFLQILHFRQEHAARIWVVGAASLPDEPKLLDGEKFAAAALGDEQADSLQVTVAAALPEEFASKTPREAAQQVIEEGRYDAVVYIPPDFAEELAKYRIRLLEPKAERGRTDEVLQPQIF